MSRQARAGVRLTRDTDGRRRMASFVAQAPLIIGMTDLELRFIEVSPRWREAMGIERDAIVGQAADVLLGDGSERSADWWARRLAGEPVAAERVRIPLPDGRRPWFQVEITPWRDEAGEIGGLLMAGHEITDMVEALEMSQRSEERLKMAAELADMHVWEMDYVARTLSKIGAEDTFYDSEMSYERLFRNIWEGIRPDYREACQAAWDRHVRTGAPYRVEYPVTRTDDQEVWAFSTSELITDSRGKPRRLVGAMQNITARKQAEAAMARARDESEAANRAKSEFVANMSHEIRTPMNGIVGMNALLMRTSLTVEQRKYAEAVRVSADSLLAIINDILDISKLEAGKIELEEIDFSLPAIVEDVVELLSPRAADKGLEIAAFVDEDARRMFKGDPTRLRQVLLNLLSNALKFTETGFVAVEVQAEAVGADRSRLRLEVQDTGIGLTDATKGKLFEKFQQADGSITRKYGGTGLGLSICRQLIGLMGGEVGVRDRPGGGSVFWVDVELAHGASAPAPRAATPEGLRGVRILVVDDIALNRSIFARQLEAEGAVVAEADSGPACLAALVTADAEDRPIDIVLLDHMMPGMAGDLVAQKIRANGSMKQPKLVLASSIGAPMKSDLAAQVGFDAFLTKPVRHQVLVSCLAEQASSKLEPADCDPTLGKAPPPTAPARKSGGHVLLAEDNEINTLLACTLLEQAGYSVDCVVNGAEAVEAVSRRTYDVILMDVQMPIMDGLAATRLIRASGGPAAVTPIIAMTANAMATDREACLAAGMDEFISKPIDADAFLELVGRFPKSQAAPPVAPDLDDSQLDSLARLLPVARLKAVVESYLGAAEGRLERIEACVANWDLEAMAGEAHDLKGVSGNFGARRLQELAERLEQACKAKDADESAALVAEIRQASMVAWDLVARRLADLDDEKAVA